MIFNGCLLIEIQVWKSNISGYNTFEDNGMKYAKSVYTGLVHRTVYTDVVTERCGKLRLSKGDTRLEHP
ncbi:Uncharacterised protein [uncultured archaeon]|nr:Uncharacterised protein [uncultured archaeon]